MVISVVENQDKKLKELIEILNMMNINVNSELAYKSAYGAYKYEMNIMQFCKGEFYSVDTQVAVPKDSVIEKNIDKIIIKLLQEISFIKKLIASNNIKFELNNIEIIIGGLFKKDKKYCLQYCIIYKG